MAPFIANPKDAEYTVRHLLELIGEDPDREGLRGTPSRVVRAWCKLFGGYAMTAEQVLGTSFEEYGQYEGMVLLKDINFTSTCEHHLLPIVGRVHIAYLPAHRVVGVSKLARLVEMHSRRLQIQERMTADIADDLERVLKPLGVAVLVEAQHHCITSRGVEKINAIMKTSKLIGAFMEQAEVRAEFLSMVGGNDR